MVSNITEDDIRGSNALHGVHKKLASDLQYFARRTLKLINKRGKIVSVEFSDAQLAIHHACEHMISETGWVRILIVKGRQQGCSTYVAARYYHKAISMPATRVYILSHEASSTKVLFGKVLMYNEQCPEQIKPQSDVENRTETEFKNYSRYTVGTAGSSNTGRGDTCLLHHYSEPAFYEKPEDIKSGLGQTLPDLPGTEAIWESTCNGYNYWRTDVYSAIKKQGIYTIHVYRDEHGKRKCRLIYKRNGNEGQYRVIFIPWHISEEYRLPVPEGFNITEEEAKLKKLYDLDDEQLVWRRAKIEFFKSERKFKQEYPFTVAEAFQQSGASFFNPLDIQRAMQSKVTASYGATILGVDGSAGGDEADRAVIVKRRGRQMIWKRVYYNHTQIQIAAKVADLLNDPLEQIDKVFVDRGYGDAIVECLRNRDFGPDLVEAVSFAATPRDEQYLNLRAEMFHSLRDWLANELEQVSIPDDPEIEIDLMMLPDVKETDTGRKKFPKKREIKDANGGMSPDILDALALTFAYPVKARYDESGVAERQRNSDRRMPPPVTTGLRTRQRTARDSRRMEYGSDNTNSVRCWNSRNRGYASVSPALAAKRYNATEPDAATATNAIRRYATANGKPAVYAAKAA